MYGIGVNNSAVDLPNTCYSLLKKNENKVTIDLEGGMCYWIRERVNDALKHRACGLST